MLISPALNFFFNILNNVEDNAFIFDFFPEFVIFLLIFIVLNKIKINI